MKTRIVCFLLLVLPGLALEAAIAPGPAKPFLHKVTDGVYTVIGQMDAPNAANRGYMCNVTFIITGKGVVVVDSGGSLENGRMLIRHIRRITDKPVTHVINTHAHADHWFGNHAFSQLTPKPVIIGHANMKKRAREIAPRWLRFMERSTKGASRGTRPVLPDRTVTGNTVLKTGGVEIRLIHTGFSHTRGDLVVWLPQKRVLITGDVLTYKRIPGMRDASPLGNIRALEMLLQLPARHVVPGHGPVSDRRAIRYMLGYLRLLRREVARYQDQGLQPYEMLTRINVGKYVEMAMFSHQFRNNVFRMYHDIEQAQFGD